MALSDWRRLANADGRPLRLDAGEYFFRSSEIAVGRHQQAAQGEVGATQVKVS